MSRYFIRPKMASWTAPPDIEDAENKPIDLTVWPLEDDRNTGLLDADGNPIMATDRVPIGFLTEDLDDDD
jgi:hypothetical protein